MNEEHTREQNIQETLERLRQPKLGRDTVTLLTVRLLELMCPEKRVEAVSESELKLVASDGSNSMMYLHNLWAECEQSPDDRAEIVQNYVRVLAPSEDMKAKEVATLENIVCLVRDSVYYNAIGEQDRDVLTEHLVGDLWVILAVDLPFATNVLTVKEVTDLGAINEELYRVGINNVAQLLDAMEFKAYGECYTVSCENLIYASSTLLLDYVWNQAAALVNGDVVVAVPARDTVLFTGANNAAGIKELRDEAAYVLANGHHLVSGTLLRRSGGKWTLLS